MNKPRALIIRAPGTNCDREAAYALELAGAEPSLVHMNEMIARVTSLRDYSIFIIPGGFSYGDDLGAGKVMANELEQRLRDQVLEFVDRGGVVLGICNGFQILVRAGLLPVPFGGQRISLLPNTSGRFECRWVHLRIAEGNPCVFTQGLESLDLAVAHGEGRLYVPESVVSQVVPVLRYASRDGSEPRYPDDPNGSFDHIAGICDASGRILGLMPHPERFVRASQHPGWSAHRGKDGAGDGLTFFINAVKHAKSVG
ncbi:MAG: phosphoribosylformylglycinamidine synthase I [Dehalococcoidia bacterium]|nr:phosphoribosylformylglycinamidine synthase I [Dehalococcoidia bacterium]